MPFGTRPCQWSASSPLSIENHLERWLSSRGRRVSLTRSKAWASRLLTTSRSTVGPMHLWTDSRSPCLTSWRSWSSLIKAGRPATAGDDTSLDAFDECGQSVCDPLVEPAVSIRWRFDPVGSEGLAPKLPRRRASKLMWLPSQSGRCTRATADLEHEHDKI